jgi:hypothetical protein
MMVGRKTGSDEKETLHERNMRAVRYDGGSSRVDMISRRLILSEEALAILDEWDEVLTVSLFKRSVAIRRSRGLRYVALAGESGIQ